MENTWYKYITIEVLESFKKEYLNHLTKNPNSSIVKRFYDEFRSSFIYNTNAIEGNRITEYDTAYIINSNTFLENYSMKENMEVLGSNRAWNYILTLPKINLDTILKIHKNILFFDIENAGIFRNSPVKIGDKQMLPFEKIEESIYRLLEFKGNSGIFEYISEFHLRFENIHPFIDGNGRSGRMLINLELLKNGYLPINIKFNDVGKYYRCFRQYDISKNKGIQEMFNIITKYEYDELKTLNEFYKR